MTRILSFLIILAFLFAACSSFTHQMVTDPYGAVVRMSNDKTIHLVFSADSAFEGATMALDAMKARKVKGSFFFTGRFLRMPENDFIINRIIADGHYIGGHSDGHLQYADWDNARTNLVADDSLVADLNLNYAELCRWNITPQSAPYYLPPYEWYNVQNVAAINSTGLVTVNFTPGLWTSDDYTTPDMENYRSSQELLDLLYDFEQKRTLNGAIMLIHLGTHQLRTDKFYRHLPAIIDSLSTKGYRFKTLSDTQLQSRE